MTNLEGQRGGKLKLDEKDRNYDEFMESKQASEIQKMTMERIYKALELASRAEEDRETLLQESIEDIESDPYMAFVFKQFSSMPASDRGMVEAVAEKRNFKRSELNAFTNMITSLDFAAVDPETVFKTSYLKMVVGTMTPDQKISLMLQVPTKVRTDVIAVMRTMGLMSSHDIENYTRREMTENNPAAMRHRMAMKKDIDVKRRAILKTIKGSKGTEINYKAVRYEHPRNRMERKYTLGNVLKAGGMFASIMTFVINTGGAVRLLVVKRDPKAALDHIMKHPYIGLSIAGMAGFSRALNQPDRPLSELAVTGKRPRLNEMIQAGISTNTITAMRDPKVYREIKSNIGGKLYDDAEAMRTQDLKVAMPGLAKYLEGRGLLPKTAPARKKMMRNFVDMWRMHERWEYKNYASFDKFLYYSQKNYFKAAKGEGYRAAEEAEEQKNKPKQT